MKKTTYTFIIICCQLIAITRMSNAQDGSLDLSFSSDGKVTTAIGISSDGAQSIALQSDGKIVAGGESSNGADLDFALVRYNSDGSLDNSFDTDGIITTPLGSGNDEIFGLVIQSDGKIVAAGDSYNGSDYDLALVRYNSDGSLDNTFGTGGIVTEAIASGSDHAASVLVQADGKIVVAGHGTIGATSDFILVRFNSDGTMDGTFGSGGIATTDFGTSDDLAYSAAIQSDGKIVVAGRSDIGGTTDFALVRYNSDGTLDNSFDTDGKVTTDIGGGSDLSYSVAIQTDNKIVVAGYSYNGSDFDFALVRYNSNGTLDNSLDTDGKTTTDIQSDFDPAYTVLIQNDGKMVVVGRSSNGTQSDFALVRYNSDGSLDNSFSTDGKVTTGIGSGDDFGFSAALQSDGKIVVAGFSIANGDWDIGLVRYNNSIVGILENNAEENKIIVSPNPFTTEIVISGTAGRGEVIIYDVLGKEMLQQKISSSDARINTEKLLPGIYLLTFLEETKTMKLEKF